VSFEMSSPSQISPAPAAPSKRPFSGLRLAPPVKSVAVIRLAFGIGHLAPPSYRPRFKSLRLIKRVVASRVWNITNPAHSLRRLDCAAGRG
jgi:hypothetical protein